jgi:hypothetical protein
VTDVTNVTIVQHTSHHPSLSSTCIVFRHNREGSSLPCPTGLLFQCNRGGHRPSLLSWLNFWHDGEGSSLPRHLASFFSMTGRDLPSLIQLDSFFGATGEGIVPPSCLGSIFGTTGRDLPSLVVLHRFSARPGGHRPSLIELTCFSA